MHPLVMQLLSLRVMLLMPVVHEIWQDRVGLLGCHGWQINLGPWLGAVSDFPRFARRAAVNQ